MVFSWQMVKTTSEPSNKTRLTSGNQPDDHLRAADRLMPFFLLQDLLTMSSTSCFSTRACVKHMGSKYPSVYLFQLLLFCLCISSCLSGIQIFSQDSLMNNSLPGPSSSSSGRHCASLPSVLLSNVSF